jgi:hypothetical protein
MFLYLKRMSIRRQLTDHRCTSLFIRPHENVHRVFAYSQPNGQNLTGGGLGNFTGSAGAYVPWNAEVGLMMPRKGMIVMVLVVAVAVTVAGGG